MEHWRCPFWIAAVVFGLTVAQLLVAVFVPGIERFEDRPFPSVWWSIR